MSSNHNPYFPAISPGNGLLSQVLCEAPIVSKIKLEALPSPALQPPSPLSLDGPGADTVDDVLADSGVPTAVRGSPVRGDLFNKRRFIARPSSLSSLSSLAQGQETLDAVSESLSAFTTSETPVSSPALETPSLETPELTIESMRASSYVRVPHGWRRPPTAVDADSILGPSIRRRDL